MLKHKFNRYRQGVCVVWLVLNLIGGKQWEEIIFPWLSGL